MLLAKYGAWTHYRLQVASTIFLLFLFFGLLPKSATRHENVRAFFATKRPGPRDVAANSTLGFQKLLVLSTKPSWRTRGLKAAADLTGLEFTVPPQPHNPEELLLAFAKIGADRGAITPLRGAATAWLSHIDLLKHVIASDLQTALIVEDDVDWDIRIKSQIKLISDNVRMYTNVPDTDPTPYGADWDILWIGHCGASLEDWIPPPLVYADESRCKTNLYSSWSKPDLRGKLAEGHRAVQVSATTVCSFGYAVTKQSAQKVLNAVGRGADEAFDVSLGNNCRSGVLRCLVINPQVMNHYEPPRGAGYLSLVNVGDGLGNELDESTFELVRGSTGDIMKSARCKALFDSECMELCGESEPLKDMIQ